MKKPALALTFLLIAACPLYAAESKVISLQDGSKVKGEIVSMENGIYTVQTQTLGEIKVPDSSISSITTEAAMPPTPQDMEAPRPGQPPALPSNLMGTPEFKSMQNRMMSDPDVMGEIQKLAQDPEVMAIMTDPGFMAAVQSGNTAALQSDPRLRTLADHPKIRALMEKMQAEQPAQN